MEEVKKELGKLRDDKLLIIQQKDKHPRGPGNMHTRVLREVGEQVSKMLADVFNSSLESAQAPEEWRVAKVTPLFKEGSREDFRNYRSVSLTSVVGKVLEMLIKGRMGNHLNNFKLVKGSQHRFTKSSSCLTNLLEFCEQGADLGG